MASPTSASINVSLSRRLFWPALTAASMLGITLWLGIWQVERLHWKTGLLSEIARAEAAPPVPLPAKPSPFEKVAVTGTLRPDLAVRYGTEVRSIVTGSVLGSQVVMPVQLPDARLLLVDLGWLPDAATPSVAAGPVTLSGYVRPAEPAGPLAPGPDLAGRRFWSLDPAAIGSALGLGSLMPYTLVVLGPAAAVPSPAGMLPRPPNNHLFYALTWFGLAACLVVVFAVYARRTLRS